MADNVMCDGYGFHRCKAGEVRVLPVALAHSVGSNRLVCRNCFEREIAWRNQRNSELGEFAQYALPSWESLEIYKG